MKDRMQEVVEPPVEFVHDLNYACSRTCEIKERCGVTGYIARKLRAGKPVTRGMLESAMIQFYGEVQDVDLNTEIQALLKLSRRRRDRFISTLRQAARFVQDYAELRLNKFERQYWIFPPRDKLRKLVDIREELKDLLYRIWRCCANQRKMFFGCAPELAQEFAKQSLKQRTQLSGATRKERNKVRKASRKTRT